MIVYHGSSVLFERFDLSHVMEGDGKVKFGWGVYVTEKYNTAAHYAYNKKRPENKTFYVYTVEIPDRKPGNCLSLLKRIPVLKSIIERTQKKLGETIPEEATAEGIPFRKWLANRLIGNIKTISQMTKKSTIEGEQAASEFLLGIGVELIEWPVDWGKPDGEKNMTVLSDSKVRILRIEKVELDKKDHLIEGSQTLVKEF